MLTGAAQILVCFAVKEELRPFQKFARARPELRVLLTGMGRRNALQALGKQVVRDKPKLVVTAGFAGGLNPQLHSGVVLFAGEATPAQETALVAAGAQRGTFYCTERVATTAREKAELRQRTGADAVEMESAIISQKCQELGIPSLTVRVILDTANEDLPLDFNRLLNSRDELEVGKVVRELVRAPGRLPALLRLQRQSARAAKRLAHVLEAALA
ncbi:MAG: hypothetical protein ACREIC_24635 [Limisphaerales bacterium]